ncbi:MAG TPA: hypothetical protein VK358_11190, partial [Longimicrobium sp.]|nr:hypothetical protein [Longimicrobium sp.]
RWAMLLVGGGMAFAVDERWWVWLSIAGMLILILAMGMSQERWLTRERHQLITSALKRTAVTGRSRKKASQGTRTRRGANPSKRSLHGL